jgi:Flp pilus assembly pilin Flp
MLKLMAYFRSLKGSRLSSESGQTLTEYALLLGLVALAAIGSLTALQGGLGGFYNDLVSALTAAFG